MGISSGVREEGLAPLWKIRLAPDVSSVERRLVQGALEKGTVEENRILESHSRVKKFFKVEAGSSSLFIKLREYPSWPRRLARWFTKTKEERELQNYLLLRRAQVPCPRPICSGRKGWIFPAASALVTVFLENTRPLREVWLREFREEHLSALIALLERLARARAIVQDLQWNNLLLEERGGEAVLYLIDPLHVRIWEGRGDPSLERSIEWFLAFMRKEGAEGELVRYVRERLDGAGFPVSRCSVGFTNPSSHPSKWACSRGFSPEQKGEGQSSPMSLGDGVKGGSRG